MGRKRGRGYQKKENEDNDNTSRKVSRSRSNNDEQDMDDDIDVFHKQRDKIQLDVTDDFEESDEDSEVPVLDMEDIKEEDEDEDEDEDDYEDDDVKKIIKTKKYLKAKLGGVDDDMHDEDEEDDNHPMVWDRRLLHSADNRKFELLSSDDEAPEEEEKEARAIQMRRVENFTMEDLGLEDEVPGSDKELTLEEMSQKRKSAMRSSENDATMDTTSLDVKDLNALSKDEQLEVMQSTAPELFVLLSELDEALEQLESKINPFLTKVKSGEIVVEGGIHYFEVKQLLLLSYCQAISFYLLLKSEGHPVRDHPVIARLVELKNLLDQTKDLDQRLPIKLEEILQRNQGIETTVKLGNNGDTSEYDSFGKVKTRMQHPVFLRKSAKAAAMQACEEDKLQKPKKGDMIEVKKDLEQNNQVGKQSLEMLKVREALEKKLNEKGVFKSMSSKSEKFQKQSRIVNGKLETYDDFDDVAVSDGRKNNLCNESNDLSSTKVSKLLRTKQSKAKVISGDDDLPKRDDIGERRRKFEVQVLARAGVKSEDDIGDGFESPGSDEDADIEEDEIHESGKDELYKQAEQRLAAKRTAKSQAYTRKPPLASLAETVDGKRHISYQMEKNRGLTRPRNKLTKNPRKKYKLKHQKAVKRLQGRVPNLKQQSGVYSGELHGINAAVSKSVRLKS